MKNLAKLFKKCALTTTVVISGFCATANAVDIEIDQDSVSFPLCPISGSVTANPDGTISIAFPENLSAQSPSGFSILDCQVIFPIKLPNNVKIVALESTVAGTSEGFGPSSWALFQANVQPAGSTGSEGGSKSFRGEHNEIFTVTSRSTVDAANAQCGSTISAKVVFNLVVRQANATLLSSGNSPVKIIPEYSTDC